MPEDNDKNDGLGPISRREFTIASVAILGSGATPATVAKPRAQNASPAAEKGRAPRPLATKPLTSSARTIRLMVNKWKYEVQVEPDWVLRDVLREQLGCLSVKDMCNGHGACGSCSVNADGRPILSCMTLAVECDGMNIETAEGVAEAMPALVEAYVMNHCMQCGYCTPGFIVTAKALLDRIPNPTEADIREALGGNICRCGTYPQHILAILEATTGKS